MPNDSEAKPAPDGREEVVVPVIEEELVAGTRPVKTGGVRVDKHVETQTHRVEGPLFHEDVEVRRVPINRVVGERPSIRQKGETVIVPVVEEELVVTKRLVLKEEIHLIRRRTRERFVKEVKVDRESAAIRRLDSQGRIIDDPEARPAARRPIRHRSVLE